MTNLSPEERKVALELREPIAIATKVFAERVCSWDAASAERWADIAFGLAETVDRERTDA